MDPFMWLPPEIMVIILNYMTPRELHCLKTINKNFNNYVHMCIKCVHKGKFIYTLRGQEIEVKTFLEILRRMPPNNSLVFPKKETYILFAEDYHHDEINISRIIGKGLCLQRYLIPRTITGEYILADLAKVNTKLFEQNHKYRMYIIARKPPKETLVHNLLVEDFISFILIINCILKLDRLEIPNALIHYNLGIIDYVSLKDDNSIIPI